MKWTESELLFSFPPPQVARCTKIIDADTEHPKFMIHVKQFAKFVVNLHKNLAPTDVEEGMRVG